MATLDWESALMMLMNCSNRSNNNNHYYHRLQGFAANTMRQNWVKDNQNHLAPSADSSLLLQAHHLPDMGASASDPSTAEKYLDQQEQQELGLLRLMELFAAAGTGSGAPPLPCGVGIRDFPFSYNPLSSGMMASGPHSFWSAPFSDPSLQISTEQTVASSYVSWQGNCWIPTMGMDSTSEPRHPELTAKAGTGGEVSLQRQAARSPEGCLRTKGEVSKSHREVRRKSQSDRTITDNRGSGTESVLFDELSSQVLRHFQLNRQPDVLFQRKVILRDELYLIICQRLFPKCGLYIVGSSMNGLGTNCSDMDLCLMITNDEICQRTHAVDILHRIANLLESCQQKGGGSENYWEHPFPVARSQQLILAKVPILRVQFGPPFEDIQVDLNANNSVAIKNTHLLYYYSKCDWRLCPLVVIVKEWAKRNGINDASKSTVSSYSLVLMVIHYLQAGVKPPVLPNLQRLYPHKFHHKIDVRRLNIREPLYATHQHNHPFVSRNKESLGQLFFDLDVVSVRTGAKLCRKDVAGSFSQYNDPYQWRCLCIEEPFSLANTAHSVYDERVFEMVKDCLNKSYDALRERKDLKEMVGENWEEGRRWTNVSYGQLCGTEWSGSCENFGKDSTVDSGFGSELGLKVNQGSSSSEFLCQEN